jgi:hypothetical protein
MIIKKRIEKLEADLAWWQDKLNRSRKNSLRALRAMHLNAVRKDLDKLKGQQIG